jgi:allophanate hydrolase
VAVARGLATFALGTDTAGSGRVPAGFNNIVGLKPSRGLLSTTGVVPACRTLDCVSIFALTCPDAWRVFEAVCQFDAQDPLSRRWADIAHPDAGPSRPFRFGVPAGDRLDFQGDGQAQAMFARAVEILQTLGGEPVAIDFSPFRDVARNDWRPPAICWSGIRPRSTPLCALSCRVLSRSMRVRRFAARSSWRA